uniref:Uncharacterized protein n=1 Tax=Pararge aegeria TaxID=116150 RepID=S4P9D4_9NEOP
MNVMCIHIFSPSKFKVKVIYFFTQIGLKMALLMRTLHKKCVHGSEMTTITSFVNLNLKLLGLSTSLSLKRTTIM